MSSNNSSVAAETIAKLCAQLDAAKARLQRVTDLVRYQRAELHESNLISDEEYAELAAIKGSPARLESYDDVRAKLAEAQANEARLAQERDNCKSLWQQGIEQNARLASACEAAAGYIRILTVCGMGTDLEEAERMGKEVLATLNNPSTALSDLLGPTVDKLPETIRHLRATNDPLALFWTNELARLRAAMGQKV